MSATNLTRNLKLSQFVASDKPSWLGDVNGDNKKIDDGYGVLAGEISKANNTASSAKSQSDANTQTLTNVNSELEDYGNRITALESGGGTEQLEQRVNTLSTDVEALQTKSDTFEENITQNGTNITNVTNRVTTLETTTRTNSDNITNLLSTAEGLTTTVQTLTSSVNTASKNSNEAKSIANSAQQTATQARNDITEINNTLNSITPIGLFDASVSSSFGQAFSKAIVIDSTAFGKMYALNIAWSSYGSTIQPSRTKIATITINKLNGKNSVVINPIKVYNRTASESPVASSADITGTYVGNGQIDIYAKPTTGGMQDIIIPRLEIIYS